MKEIKAFIHRQQLADVVHELQKAGFAEISIIDVKGTFDPINEGEREYSMEIGQEVITETKIEVFCDDALLQDALHIIRLYAGSKNLKNRRIYVSDTVALPFETSPYG